MKIEIYSDIACPWCYIGEHRLARALAAYPRGDEVEVVFRSYQLDPNAPETAVPLREYLTQRYGPNAAGMLDQVSDAAHGEGLEIDWDRALSVNTLTAHRLLRLAELEYGATMQRALAEKLFEAHFARGGDVAKAELLTELAAAVGLDATRVREYLDSDEGLEETRYEIYQAQRLGIRSVPTFIIEGKFAVQGAQPASVFLQALEQVAAKLEEERAVESGSGDATEGGSDDVACADGSCAL